MLFHATRAHPTSPAVTPPLQCTVVVIAMHGGANLEACLEALRAQGATCLVMLGADLGGTGAWDRRFPAMRFVDAATIPIPMRRMQGVQAAETELVAFIEDNSVPCEHWLSAILEAFVVPSVTAVGGAVTIAADLDNRQTALACCEYGRFHPSTIDSLAPGRRTQAAGPVEVDRLPGNNLAYRKAALQAVTKQEGALIESQVNAALQSAGGRLQILPRMEVEYRPRDNHGTRLRDRFQHGRLYAANCTRRMPPGGRVLYLFKTSLLPAVLSGRSLRWLRRSVRPRAWLAVGWWVCCMESAWSAGEAVGCIAGPGRSMEAWH